MFNYKSLTEKCQMAKEELNPQLKEIWSNINSTKNWGCCTYLYKKYGCPSTVEDFYIKYTTDDDDNNNPKEHGRNKDYIWSYAEMLSEYVTAPTETIYWYIVQKLIVDTFNGCQKEQKAKELLVSKGYSGVSPTLEEDTEFAIDLKVYNENKHLFNLQVKPDTFFKGNTNQSLIRDRISAFKKDLKAKNKYGVPTLYLVYSKETGSFIHNPKGKYLFRLTDLVNNDGTVN